MDQGTIHVCSGGPKFDERYWTFQSQTPKIWWSWYQSSIGICQGPVLSDHHRYGYTCRFRHRYGYCNSPKTHTHDRRVHMTKGHVCLEWKLGIATIVSPLLLTTSLNHTPWSAPTTPKWDTSALPVWSPMGPMVASKPTCYNLPPHFG